MLSYKSPKYNSFRSSNGSEPFQLKSPQYNSFRSSNDFENRSIPSITSLFSPKSSMKSKMYDSNENEQAIAASSSSKHITIDDLNAFNRKNSYVNNDLAGLTFIM